jgi:serine/threonine protein kinase
MKGSGAFSDVFLVKRISDNELYALKKVRGMIDNLRR